MLLLFRLHLKHHASESEHPFELILSSINRNVKYRRRIQIALNAMMWNSSDDFWIYNESWIGLEANWTTTLVNETVPNIDIYSSRNVCIILVYMILFLIAAIGNLTVFISLFRSRHRKSRISLMIRHLAIADLIVTFVMIPIETIIHNLFTGEVEAIVIE
ncbi:hypothetical protein HUJ05_011375 [Dendroctonus ponderosae]|nr:hypothetical protein HUJ05_011375 [Dendroctonus ponderosae]